MDSSIVARQVQLCSKEELEGLGYAIAIYPGLCFTAAMKACMDEAQHLKETGIPRDPGNWRERFDERNDFFGLSEYLDREDR